MKNDQLELVAILSELPDSDVAFAGSSALAVNPGTRYEEIAAKARRTWALAAFSGHSKQTLRRYYSYHMCLISDALVAGSPGSEKHLVLLAGHLCTYFSPYLDKKMVMPEALLRYKFLQVQDKADLVISLLAKRMVDDDLKNCIVSFLDIYLKKGDKQRVTFGMIDYLELLMEKMQEVLQFVLADDINQTLEECLLAINFNYLEFFRYLTRRCEMESDGLSLTDQSALLLAKAASLPSLSSPHKLFCDPLLPGIATMYKSWLKEEAASIAETISGAEASAEVHKIGLNLSVAELACLVRLFFENGLFLDASITAVLRSIPCHFSAKRQPVISPGSFSVKYYSSEQKAAAKIKALLLKMIAWLNKHYFPVVVAISAVIAVR